MDNNIFNHCENEFLENVKLCVEKYKVNPESQNDNGNTPLHSACFRGNFPIVKYLIEECKVNPEPINKDGCTPLHEASWCGHINIVKYLLEECNVVDIDKKNNFGRTPLFEASYGEHFEIIKYLINFGADTKKAKDVFGKCFL